MVSPIRIRVPPLTKALQITRKIGDMRKSLSLSPVHRLGVEQRLLPAMNACPSILERILRVASRERNRVAHVCPRCEYALQAARCAPTWTSGSGCESLRG